MNDRLKKAFEQVRAEDELKNKTKEYIYRKTKDRAQAKTVGYRYLIPVVSCMVLLVFGVHWLYFTPTVEISIDINPSIELSINRFDRVISVKGYNDDGGKLEESLDIKYMDYSDAVSQIIKNDEVADLLSDDEIMTIAVVGEGEEQSLKVFSEIETFTQEESNAYCYYAHLEEVKEAHETGFSYGKYRAFLELQKVNPDITAKEVKNMTMREIRDLIDELSDDEGRAESSNGEQRRGYQENAEEKGQKRNQRQNGKKDK